MEIERVDEEIIEINFIIKKEAFLPLFIYLLFLPIPFL